MRVFALLLGAVFVLLCACGDSEGVYVTPVSQGTPEPTPPWAGRQAEAKGGLDEMVLTKEDLPSSLGWLEPAEDPPEELKPIIAPERDPLTMNGLPWRPGSAGPLRDLPWEASAFVGRDGDVWLWSFVTLPDDLDTLSAVRRAMVDAAQLDVAKLRLDIWDSLLEEELGLKPEDVRIGGAKGLGDVRFAHSLSLYNVEGEEQYQVQGFAFTRGPVFAVLLVVCRPGALGQDDSAYLAFTFDDKISETLKAAGLLEA